MRDSDGDGVIDSEDYAPEDPAVQEKADVQRSDGGLGSSALGLAVAGVLGLVGFSLLRSRLQQRK